MCVCVWILDCDPLNVCVCVCVWKMSGSHITVKNMPDFFAERRICQFSVSDRQSLKKIYAFKSSVQLLGAPWQESNPGMIVKKTLPALGADIWLMLSKRKKSSFSEMWTEWSNNRNCAAWPWPSSFCMEGDRTGLFSREGWMLPFRIRFLF